MKWKFRRPTMGSDLYATQDAELRSKWWRAELTGRKYLVSGELCFYWNLKKNLFLIAKLRQHDAVIGYKIDYHNKISIIWHNLFSIQIFSRRSLHLTSSHLLSPLLCLLGRRKWAYYPLSTCLAPRESLRPSLRSRNLHLSLRQDPLLCGAVCHCGWYWRHR